LKNITPCILKAFLLGALINVSTNFIYAIYRGVIENEQGINFWYFTYEFLSEPFGIQPIYLGLFYVFAILILNHFKSKIANVYFYYSAILLLTLGVFLLSARIAILCLILLVPLQLLFTKKISIKNILMLLGVFGISFLFAIQNPVVKNRIFKVTKEGNFYSGTSLRSTIWESAYYISKENIIWGLGEKKADILLVEEFKDRDLTIPAKYRYHSHNQYLQTLVQYGIIGLLVLLGALFWPMVLAVRKLNYLGLLWLLLFSISAVTESVFTRQWGIFSFAFFSSLLMLNDRKSEI
jgi:O-antigen ligase